MSSKDKDDGLTDAEEQQLVNMKEWGQWRAVDWVRRLARENAELKASVKRAYQDREYRNLDSDD